MLTENPFCKNISDNVAVDATPSCAKLDVGYIRKKNNHQPIIKTINDTKKTLDKWKESSAQARFLILSLLLLLLKLNTKHQRAPAPAKTKEN